MMNDIDIKRIFGTPKFQALQDDLAAATGLAIIAVDYAGKPVTQHSKCCTFCNMVRSNSSCRVLCERCDSRGGLEAARTHAPYIYTCHSGIIDFAIPIIYNGSYLGAILAGQVLPADDASASLEQIYSDAKANALRTGKYFEAYRALPRMKLEQVIPISEMLFKVCTLYLEVELNKLVSAVPDAPDETQESPDHRDNIPAAKNVLLPVYDYIDKNIFQPLSLSHVASECNISANYLSRLFRKYNHMTFSQFVNLKKVEYAKNLLIFTDMSVQDIAMKLGYNDCSYFIKVFRSFTNVSPKVFQQQKK